MLLLFTTCVNEKSIILEGKKDHRFKQFLPVCFRLFLKKFLVFILCLFQFLFQLQYLFLLPLYPYPDIQCFSCHNIHPPLSL